MRYLRVLLPCLVAFAVALGALAAPASAATPAPVPTWHQGQAVGYGIHLDLGSVFQTYLALLMSGAVNTSMFNELNVSGSLDSWQVDTVSGATSTYYTLTSDSAQGLKLHEVVNITEKLPVAGTYVGSISTGCIPTVPTVNQTVAETLDATILVTGSGTTRVNVTDLAYISAVDNTSIQANVVFTGYHIPSSTFNFTTCTEVVSYTNPSYTLKVDMTNEIQALFDPYWKYFDFPITDNKTWWANSTAVVSAKLAGTIDVKGLSSQDAASFFENVTKAFESVHANVTGLTSFPIDLAKVSISEAGIFLVENGTVRPTPPLPIQAQFRASSSATLLSDGNLYPTYLITDAAYACPYTGAPGTIPVGVAAVYAPDFPSAGAGMIVGYQLITCVNGSNFSTYELKNTKPADARQNISRTEQTYQLNPPAQANALVDFFTQSPYWGLILIAAVVVVVAALLVYRRRHRPAAAPPATPPPTSPPPSGPGNP